MNHENNNSEKCIYSLKARNYWRYTAIFLLVSIAIAMFVFAWHFAVIAALLGIYCLAMVFIIRFPRIEVYSNRFELVRAGMFKKLTIRNKYFYHDISNVEFSKGYTNWFMIIIRAVFVPKRYGGMDNTQYSKGDSMLIKTADAKNQEIGRIGNKDDFQELICFIKRNLS